MFALTEAMARYCAESQEALIALIKTLAAIPAPSNHEEKRAAFILDWLKRAGAEGARIDEACNVVLPMGCEGRNDIRIYMAHTDVVFPDETPLPVREDVEKIHAPGVGDDTANVCVLLMCIRYILENRLKPTTPVLFAFNTGEEGLGNLRGIRQLMKDHAGRVASVVSLDGTLEGLCDCAVGSERWRVSVETEGGHSYANFGNRNAIHGLASMIATLYEAKVPPEGTTTYNVGLISGGTSVNTIAQQAEMLYEYRADRRENLAAMARMFGAVIEAYRAMGLTVTTELLGQRPCMGDVDPKALEALLTRCAGLIERETGKAPTRHSGSTDANIHFSLGIPATTFGAYRGRGAHTREEWIEKASLLPGLRVAMALVLEHFGVS